MPTMFVIYRKSDYLICAYVHPPMGVDTELSNLVKSAKLGFAPTSAYGMVETDHEMRANEMAVILGDGRLIWRPTPKNEAKDVLRASIRGKLQAVGLTAEETTLLLGRAI